MNLSGVLIVDKPCGVTSHDVVLKLRRMLGVKSIGHAGTLDPAASGLLLACVGRATKIVQFLSRYDKEYEAVIKLGVTTDTYDGDGQVTATHTGALPDANQIQRVLLSFEGRIEQIPPPYSAVKHKGRKLYQYARAQEKVKVNPRQVEIKKLQVLDIRPPCVKLKVKCSKGTYIRGLASEMGERLGCGAHLSELRRTGAGPFSLGDALSVEELEAIQHRGDISTVMVPIEKTLAHLPWVAVNEDCADQVKHGVAIGRACIQSLEGDFGAGDSISVRDRQGLVLAMGRALKSSAEFLRPGNGEKLFEYSRVI
jgi:tRNA pseudouridine55 synthase